MLGQLAQLQTDVDDASFRDGLAEGSGEVLAVLNY